MAGVHAGWGANCKLHKDPANKKRYCKTLLTYRGRDRADLTDAQVQIGCKRWLLYGVAIVTEEGHASPLDAHKAISVFDCAQLPPDPAENLDEQLRLLAPH